MRDADALERDIYRGLIVREFGPADVDVLDYLRATSRADPEGVDP
jgi:hypothetical protein